MLVDYILNLSIFSFMVSMPLVIRSFINHRPIRQLSLWAALYAGIVSAVLVRFSFHQEGYSYDIRYAILILVFAYLGPMAGLITGSFALITRLMESANWIPATMGWVIIMLAFTIIHKYSANLKPLRKIVILFGSYIAIYVLTVPIIFHVFRDNPLFHFEYLLFIMLGTVIGGLLIESYERLHRTILEKKKMEKTLEESESKYRLIAENTSDLIMVMHKDPSLNYFSPSHELVLGHKVSELKEMDLKQLVHPDEAEMVNKTLKRLLKKNKSLSMEYRVRNKQGEWIDFEARCMPVKGDGKKTESIVIISRDISERKKAEEILLQSEKLSIVGELAAGVAHEIRNPLTTIKGFVQLYKSENESFKFNDLILSELERIEGITSEMLALGKPQAVHLEEANVTALMENTIEFLLPQANLKNIEIILHAEIPNLFITCEKNQIKQVFLNILKNAMESMKDGGEIQVRLGKSAEGECVISVRDQGCGIPEELLPRLGEPFYSLKEKGTGLGLMICHKIIKQHSGSIAYKSKLNEGTLIEMKLPLS